MLERTIRQHPLAQTRSKAEFLALLLGDPGQEALGSRRRYEQHDDDDDGKKVVQQGFAPAAGQWQDAGTGEGDAGERGGEGEAGQEEDKTGGGDDDSGDGTGGGESEDLRQRTCGNDQQRYYWNNRPLH